MAHFGGGFGGPSMYNENEDSEPEQALDDSLAMARVSESAKPSKSAASKKKDAPEQERRMLRPIAGVNHAPLKKGDEISYRQKRGKDVRKMRVLSPGLPWQEALPGSGDVTQDDVKDRDALTKAWGTVFDPVKMYTVLCDMEWRPNTIVWILYFPELTVQTALNVYVHRALRQMSGSGRGSSIGNATRRTTIAGPDNVHFDYTEFPPEAYARPKKTAGDPTPPQPPIPAAFTTKGAAPKKAADPPPPKKAKPADPEPPVFARAKPVAVASGSGSSSHVKTAKAFLDYLCERPDTAVMASSLFASLKKQRAESSDREAVKKTPWSIHPKSKTHEMTDVELETFIGTVVRKTQPEKANKAIEKLEAIRGFFGLLFDDVEGSYSPPTLRKRKEPSPEPEDDFDV